MEGIILVLVLVFIAGVFQMYLGWDEETRNFFRMMFILSGLWFFVNILANYFAK